MGKKYAPTAIAVLLALSLSSSAAADEFAGGHLFVAGKEGTSTTAQISEFDADGNHVRDIDVHPDGETTSYAAGLAFGPDGLYLYYGFPITRVVRVAPNGDVSAHLDTSDGIGSGSGLSFGPRGGLHLKGAVQEELVREIDGVTELAPVSGVNAPRRISFLPSGRRVVTDGGGAYPQLTDFGTPSSLAGPKGATASGGAIELRDHTVVVLDPGFDEFIFAHPDGRDQVGVSLPQIVAPSDLTRLANGNILFSTFSNGPLVEVTTAGAYVRTIAYADLTSPGQMAVAPYVFDAVVKGVVSDETLTLKKVKARSVRVSVDPASGTVMLAIPDLPGRDDLRDLLGGGEFVLRGHASRRAVDPKRIYVHAMIPGVRPDEGRGSAVLEVKGRVDEDGTFTAKKVTGTWHFSHGTTTFSGTVAGRVPRPE